MVHGIEITEDADSARKGAQKQVFDIALSNVKPLAGLHQNDDGKEQSHCIAEEGLLGRGQVSGQPDKHIHQGKAEGRGDDAQNAFGTTVHGKMPPYYQSESLF